MNILFIINIINTFNLTKNEYIIYYKYTKTYLLSYSRTLFKYTKTIKFYIINIINSLQLAPALFNLYQIQKDYPTMYEESMNTFLIQELAKYKFLLTVYYSFINSYLKRPARPNANQLIQRSKGSGRLDRHERGAGPTSQQFIRKSSALTV